VTHDEIEEMLGVYALDALDADERRMSTTTWHLPQVPSGARRHREVAALLATPPVIPSGRAR